MSFAVQKMSSFTRRLRKRVIDLAASKPALKPLHWRLVRGSHSREISAVVAGQQRYRSDLTKSAITYFLLRRDIHRLEKGLIMRPRRKTFATGYIGPLVQLFKKAVLSADGDFSQNPELVWASHVLKAYFEVVDGDVQAIAEAKEVYSKLPSPTGAPVANSPFKRVKPAEFPVSYEAFRALCSYRRSVRWFVQEKVSRDIIDDAIYVAAQAPSACNRQPFVFRVFDEPLAAQKIAAIPMGTKGFSQQIPGLIVIVGRLRAYPNERDRHAIYIDGSLAAMSLIFGFECQGIATCAINWPDQEPYESTMRKELSLEPDERVIMLVAFGKEDLNGLVPFSTKRPLDQIRSYQD